MARMGHGQYGLLMTSALIMSMARVMGLTPMTYTMCDPDTVNTKVMSPLYLTTPGYPNYNSQEDLPIGCQCEMSVANGNIQIRSEDLTLQNKNFDECESEYLMSSRELTIIDGEYDESIRHCLDQYTATSPENGFIHAYIYDPHEVGKRGSPGAKVRIEAIPLQCPETWQKHTHHDYCFKSMKSLADITIPQAIDKCKVQGGIMATIHSQTELDDYMKYLGSNDIMMLGIQRIAGEPWKWGDGTEMLFDNFNSPNTNGGTKCAYMDHNGGWTRINCDHVFAKDTKYFCMKNTTGTDGNLNSPTTIKLSCTELDVLTSSVITTTTPTTTTTKLTTSPTTTPKTTTHDVNVGLVSPAKQNVGLIAGMSVIGGVLALMLIVGAVFLYRRRKSPPTTLKPEGLPTTNGGSIHFSPQKGSIHSNGPEFHDDEVYNYIDPMDLDGYAVGGHAYQNGGADIERERDIEAGYVLPVSSIDYKPIPSEKGPDVDLSKLPIAPKPPGYKPKAKENDYMATLTVNMDPGSTYTGLSGMTQYEYDDGLSKSDYDRGVNKRSPKPNYDHLSQAYSGDNHASYIDPAHAHSHQNPYLNYESVSNHGRVNRNSEYDANYIDPIPDYPDFQTRFNEFDNTGSTDTTDLPLPDDYFDPPPPIPVDPSAPHPTLPHGQSSPSAPFPTLPYDQSFQDYNDLPPPPIDLDPDHTYYNEGTVTSQT